MKNLLFFLLLSYTSFAQNNLEITGDWILAYTQETPIPIQISKLEPFSDGYYIGAIESKFHQLILYKVRTFKVKEKLFLDIVELDEERKKYHYFWSPQEIFKDSTIVSLYTNSLIDLGTEDIISPHGKVLMIDTSKIMFDLVYSESDKEYIEKEDGSKPTSKFKKVVSCSLNPLLFEYLIRKYEDKMKGRSLTYYRWSFFSWDKMNPLKSKDITSITRLDGKKVASIFEMAHPLDLIEFKARVRPTDQLKKVRSFFSNYHLVRANSIHFLKETKFWLISFKDGSLIKVKTTNGQKGLYDATNKKLYANEELGLW